MLPALSTEKNFSVIGCLMVNGWTKTGLEVVGVEPSVV